MNFFRKKLKTPSGQVAVILILVIAIALIFYAVTLNFGRVAQNKTRATIASNTTTAQLASQMASYGHQLVVTQLGGERKVCGYTGILLAIISFVVAIIILVLVIVTGGGATALVAAAISALAGLANLAVQAAVVQPGLTSSWNKIMEATLSIEDQFAEQAIITGLQSAVDDDVFVPDLTDIDNDGLYGWDTSQPGPPLPRDRVSRFGLYYDAQRLKTIPPIDASRMEQFIDNFRELLLDDPLRKDLDGDPATVPDNFGLFDPILLGPVQDGPGEFSPPLYPCDIDPGHPCCLDPNTNTIPSACNVCCQPDQAPNPLEDPDDPLDDFLDIRPNCCDCASDPVNPCPPEEQCGVSTSCLDPAVSPYDPNDYPWVFDQTHENMENNDSADPFVSFHEFLGTDDEHRLFLKDMTDPNGPQIDIVATTLPAGFYVYDTTGYYRDPPFTPPDDTDQRRGIYSFFYKLADWGAELDNLNPGANVEHCYWYDPAYEPGCAGLDPATEADWPEELHQLPRLTLPNDPAGPNILFNTTRFVDSSDSNVAGNPPLATDKIEVMDYIIAQDNECAQRAFDTAGVRGFWKRGGDRYCSSTWPYAGSCPKNRTDSCEEAVFDSEGNQIGTIPIDCFCDADGLANGIDPTEFPEDVIDDIVYGMPEFFEWAMFFIVRGLDDAGFLMRNLPIWYEEAAGWLEPADGEGPCYECTAEGGALWQWKKELENIRDRLELWSEGESFAGADCEEVWCVPPEQPGTPNQFGLDECPGVSLAEQSTFDINANGIRGDTEDVTACLVWNMLDNGGNAEKFRRCKETCSTANCTELPRSLLPDFDNSAFVPPDPSVRAAWEADIEAMLTCFYDCNLANCSAMPPTRGGTCEEYFPTDPATSFDSYDTCDVNLFPWDPATFDPNVDLDIQYFSQDPANFDASVACPGGNWAAPTTTWETETDLLATTGASSQDRTAGQNCWNVCTNNDPAMTDADRDAVCQLMPQGTWPGAGNRWTDQLYHIVFSSSYNSSVDAYPLTSVQFFQLVDCAQRRSEATCGTLPQKIDFFAPGNPWYDDMVAALAGGGNPADMTAISNCFDVCDGSFSPPVDLIPDQRSTQEAVCQAMPQDNGNCYYYFPGEADPGTDFTADQCGTWGPGNFWYDAIVGAQADNTPVLNDEGGQAGIMAANPSCDLRPVDGDKTTIEDNGWLLNVEMSVPEAQNQVAKFSQRARYLNARLQEVDTILNDTDNGLNPTIQKLNDFFSGPVADFVDMRANFEAIAPRMPTHVIYGWQGEPPSDRPAPNEEQGYWHIVRVDVRTPGRCYDQCGAGGGADPPWPSIDTYTKNWGTERCYELENDRGRVMSRVTRYDENQEAGTIRFPNGMPIWTFRSSHPGGPIPSDASGLGASCQDFMLQARPEDLPPGLPPGSENTLLNGAFILNKYSDQVDAAGENECWDRAHELLEQGVTSQTCAQYYYHEGRSNGFGFRFVPCDSFQ